jgi:quinol-cytochrome oxidoreductase complex cytochrome b subunit
MGAGGTARFEGVFFMNIKGFHWRHFFGGVAFLLLIVQFFSGLVLTMFYLPHLNEAYASVQNIYNEFGKVAWIRDTHRWAAMFIFIATIMHFIRSFLRKEYRERRARTLWLTGILLILPTMGFLLTGIILPWEWRGYWFMEMVPNYLGQLAVIGPALEHFFIDVFTMNRAFVTHVVILPVVMWILFDIHALVKMRGRAGGLSRYIAVHGLFVIPFLLVIGVLAYAVPMPTQDPQIIPMPLEGAGIPTAEWFVLVFYVPYWYFQNFMAPLLSFYVPVVLFIVLAVLPYCFGKEKSELRAEKEAHANKIKKISSWLPDALRFGAHARALGFLSVLVVSLTLFGGLYTVTSVSPTMGCNSCHNILSGRRMGIPPETFKDRVKNPVLKNFEWMVQHWLYPQHYW